MVSDGNISDQFLSRQIANGREEAFDFIFRKHYRALCAQALIYIKDDDLAQSIVQDCFVSFWEKRNELKDVRNIRSYLSFMVRNRAVDHFRRIEKEQKAFSAVKGEEGTESVEMQAISEDFEYDIVELIAGTGPTEMSMPDKYYFFPIQLSNIDTNPKLEQNRDWGGNFDPTLN